MVVWEEYFNIYPFTEDRQDARTALLCQIMVGSHTGKLPKIELFLPKYIDEPKDFSLIQQAEADRAFGEKLMRMQASMRK
jgi:hypothetical protein